MADISARLSEVWKREIEAVVQSPDADGKYAFSRYVMLFHARHTSKVILLFAVY